MGAPTPPRSQAEFVRAITEGLVAAGVQHAVLSPGYRNAPLALALADSPRITSTVVIDERTAGFVALGAARATGRPVVLCCTSGSAPFHYLPAVVEARRAGVPLVVLAADRPYELQRVGAPQAVEQRGMFSAHVVYEDELCAAELLDSDVHQAAMPALTRLAVAMAHAKRGPIFLDVPLRKPLFGTGAGARDAGVPVRSAPRVYPAVRQASREALDALRTASAPHQRPVIVVGPHSGPLSELPAQHADRLSALLGWPLVGDALAGPSARRVAHADWIFASASARRALAPDFVLWIGALPTSRNTLDWISESGAPVWTVSDSLEWVDPSHAAAALIEASAADLAAFVEQTPQGWARAEPKFATRLAACSAVVGRELARPRPLWDGGAVATAASGFTAGWLHVGSSLPVRDLDGLVASAELRASSSRGANGIDGTVATAWGLAWGSGAPVRVVLGDVTLQHDIGSLGQLPRNLPLTVVVVNNSGGQIFARLPVRSAERFGEVFLTPPRYDLARAAEGFGLDTAQVNTAEALERQLALAASTNTPWVIEAVVAPDQCQAARLELSAACANAIEEVLG
jgi:2-succinyl-5-enolpyruvyl-6-hydroxy-3-cyclohexene-1-carboxylate synthase